MLRTVLLLWPVLLVSSLEWKQDPGTPRSFKHVAPRVGSRFFIRMNTKVNVVPYTAIFAYASGFRLNWDIRPADSSPLFYIGQRKEFHETLVTTLERYGLQGRDCLMRAFCELEQIQGHNDIISNILRVIFKAEEEDSRCTEMFDCPVSLISLPYLLYNGTNVLQ